MGKPISKEKRDIARTLRCIEKKTLQEIANILGISKAILSIWGKEEGWPNPQDEARALVGVVSPEKHRGRGRPKKTIFPEPETPPGDDDIPEAPVGSLKTKAGHSIPFRSFEVIPEEKPADLAERLWRWAALVVAEGARWDMRTAEKLMESSARVMIALKVPGADGQGLTFGVLCPATAERWRRPPGDPGNGEISPEAPAPAEDEPAPEDPPGDPEDDQEDDQDELEDQEDREIDEDEDPRDYAPLPPPSDLD